jgi:hypothetical protein
MQKAVDFVRKKENQFWFVQNGIDWASHFWSKKRIL